MEIFLIIGGVIGGILLTLLCDLLAFNLRGHAQPNDKNLKTNIITDPMDAHAQKLIDFYKEKN